jgi:adenine-specific DNA-methyltransferase
MDKISKVATNKVPGQVNTPQSIVEYILDNSEFSINYLNNIPVNELCSLKIMDPAVGDGIFLLEAFRRLRQVMLLKKNAVEKYIGDNDINEWILKNNLFGIDIDEKCIENTIDNLKKISGIKGKINFNILQGNTLKPNKNIENMVNEKYNYIFGNPPYSKRISKEDKEFYFKKYKKSIGGHPNLCTLFIHQSLDMLKPDGILGFLVAAPYLSSYYNRKLREMIINKYKIVELLRFIDRRNIIQNILQEFSIIVVRNTIPEKNYSVKLSTTQDLASMSIGQIKSVTMQFSNVVNGGDYNSAFLVCPSEMDYEIIHKIRTESEPLYNYCDINTGEVVQFRSKELLSVKKTSNNFPLIEISNVKKFRLEEGVKRFYKPKKGRQYIHNKKSVLMKRLTSKEQPFRIIACLSPRYAYAADNKLNVVTVKNNSIDFYLLLGILNSLLIDYYFRSYSSNTQVSANEIKFFPIPIRSESKSKKIIELSRLMAMNGFSKETFAKLNEGIFDLYEISENERKHILQYFK